MRLIQPRLVDKFICIADKCPDNCCHKWDIVWRENEVNHLKSSGNKKIYAKIPESFVGEGEYFKIKFNEEEKCPFLTDERLCEIHKDLGEKYLSYTCREYPKIARLCGDIIIRSCRISCYAVMETLCTQKNCMKTEECNAQQLHAVISPEQDGAQRARLFLKIRDIFGSSDIAGGLEIKARQLGALTVSNTEQVFSRIFGWDIICGRHGSFGSKFGTFAMNNLITAMFWEWLMIGWDSELTMEQNFSCFMFYVDALQLAADGAADHSESNEVLFCTLCDFISAILSDKTVARRTWQNINI